MWTAELKMLLTVESIQIYKLELVLENFYNVMPAWATGAMYVILFVFIPSGGKMTFWNCFSGENNLCYKTVRSAKPV